MALTTTTRPEGLGANGTGWEGDAKGDWTDPKSSAFRGMVSEKEKQTGGHGLELGVTPLAGYRPEEASLIRMVFGRGGGTA